MKKILFSLILLISIQRLFANTYYVSLTGVDTNPGTITLPFKTWAKLNSVMHPGDVAYIRGGVYTSPFGISAASASVHCYWQDLHGTSGSWITIQNYPGEIPVLDLTSVGVPTYTDPTGVYVKNCSYVHFTGLRVTGLQQNHGGSGISRGWDIDNCPNTIYEKIEVDHIGGGGFHTYNGSNDVLYLNCDSHHNGDQYSTGSAGAWGGADGFSCTGHDNSTRITYDGCRSYWNSDDGWDNFKTDGIRTFRNCQSFWNGYIPGTFTIAGDGNGFKLGPADDDISTTDRTSILRYMSNCVAFGNHLNGFDQNGTPTMRYQLYNCTAYDNGEYGFQFQYYSVLPAPTHTFKNNLAYNNHHSPSFDGDNSNYNISGPTTNINHNSWNGFTVTNADFLSRDTTGVTGPRQADGSLPNLNFLHLASGSSLINAGVDVGLSFLETNPDIGAYESNAGAPPVNQSPTANAGKDIQIKLPLDSVILAGGGTDPDGTISAYLWTQANGPSAATIVSSTSATTKIKGLKAGTYNFQLRVTDNSGATSTDNVQVNVSVSGINTTTIDWQKSAATRFNTTISWGATVSTNCKSFEVQKLVRNGFSTVGSTAASVNKTTYSNVNSLAVGTSYTIKINYSDKPSTTIPVQTVKKK